MCTSVSDKIRLCTCKVSNVDNLKHYWEVYRYNPANGKMLLGMSLDFEHEFRKPDPHNPVLLCNKLNFEIDTLFDQPMQFFDKDRLHICFHFKDMHKPTHYGFEYRKIQWRVINYDFLTWNMEHVEQEQGKVKQAVSRKSEEYE